MPKLILVILCFLLPMSALAHSPLSNVSPEDGTKMEDAPTEISMVFKSPAKLIKLELLKEKMVADLMIGFRLYRERFTSYVNMNQETLEIEVKYADGPFKYLQNSWKFLPHENGCEIDFYVDFEFQSRLFQSVIETLFSEAVRRMVYAFETRADALYPRIEKTVSKKPD